MPIRDRTSGVRSTAQAGGSERWRRFGEEQRAAARGQGGEGREPDVSGMEKLASRLLLVFVDLERVIDGSGGRRECECQRVGASRRGGNTAGWERIRTRGARAERRPDEDAGQPDRENDPPTRPRHDRRPREPHTARLRPGTRMVNRALMFSAIRGGRFRMHFGGANIGVLR